METVSIPSDAPEIQSVQSGQPEMSSKGTVSDGVGLAHGIATGRGAKARSHGFAGDATGTSGSTQGRHARCLPGQREFAGDWLARLKSDLQAKLSECSLTTGDKDLVDRCMARLSAMMLELGPDWGLRVFGSLASGFGTHGSDIDVTCMEAGAVDREEDAAVFLKKRLRPLLAAHPEFVVTEEIFNAKVPILKLRFNDCLDIDLSCWNTDALQNTRLLHAYAQFGPLVRDLGIAVKLWAKAARVCGAARGHLSSYTFTLLAIYFMQVHTAVKLPCLPTSAFKDGVEEKEGLAHVEALRSHWDCQLSLAELVAYFFAFYSLEFRWGEEVVCPRVGQRHVTGDLIFRSLRGRYNLRLHVEDPYRRERNLHCVLGKEQELQLNKAFKEAWISISGGKTPAGLRPRRRSETSTTGASFVGEAATDPGAEEQAAAAAEPAPVEHHDLGRARRGGSDDADEASSALSAAAVECMRSLRDGSPTTGSTRTESIGSIGFATRESSAGESQGSDAEKLPSACQSSDDEKEQAIVQVISDGDTQLDARHSDEEKGSDQGVAGRGGKAWSSRPAMDEEAGWQWWRHLETVTVAPAPGQREAGSHVVETQWGSHCLTVQDLETKIGSTLEGHICMPEDSGHDLLGLPFKAGSTSAIAARVSRACLAHNMRYQ